MFNSQQRDKSFLQHTHTCTGSHLVSCPLDTRLSLLAGKLAGLKAAHLLLSRAKVKNEWKHNFTTPCALMACTGTVLFIDYHCYVCRLCQCFPMYLKCEYLTVLTLWQLLSSEMPVNCTRLGGIATPKDSNFIAFHLTSGQAGELCVLICRTERKREPFFFFYICNWKDHHHLYLYWPVSE